MMSAVFARARLVCAAVLVGVCALALAAASASAASYGTGWEAASFAYPTHLPPGGKGNIPLEIVNTDGEAAPSTGVSTVTDSFPAGLTATAAGGMGAYGTSIEEEEKWACV